MKRNQRGITLGERITYEMARNVFKGIFKSLALLRCKHLDVRRGTYEYWKIFAGCSLTCVHLHVVYLVNKAICAKIAFFMASFAHELIRVRGTCALFPDSFSPFFSRFVQRSLSPVKVNIRE
ncbi:hypothetical protein Tcan_00669, partial [Toxocara canis]